MGKGSFSKTILYPWVLALMLVSCGSGVDSSSDEDENGGGMSSSLINVSSSSSAPSPSSSSSSIQQGPSSSAVSSSSITPLPSSSSSSMRQGPSSSTVSSSSLNAAGQVIFNSQSCTYTAASRYGTLACSEKVYKTVTIASASSSFTLMAENLNIGTRVPGSASSANQSDDALIEKYCYGDTEANCESDGGLYQWAEAMGLPSSCNSTTCASLVSSGNHQGICPTGWHIPTAVEWEVLGDMLGGKNVAAQKMKLNTTGYASWDTSTTNDGNSSGFSALPAGERRYTGGFYYRESSAHFWEATEYKPLRAYNRRITNGYADLYTFNGEKTFGFSVRCFKD